jgi:hypothetical protein
VLEPYLILIIVQHDIRFKRKRYKKSDVGGFLCQCAAYCG